MDEEQDVKTPEEGEEETEEKDGCDGDCSKCGCVALANNRFEGAA